MSGNTLSGFSIDKSSHIPIYAQVKDILRSLIGEERIKPNDKIPSENELSAAFAISRVTVRQAIQDLAREGYVYIKRGEGTFVNSVPRTQMLFKLDGFSAEMSKLGYKTHSKILEAGAVNASEKFRDAYSGLREKCDSPMVRIKRVRYLENAPFAVETSFLKCSIGEKVLERLNGEKFSIYGYIENELGIMLSRAEHMIEPRLAQKEASDLLGIKQGSAVLFVKGTTYSEKNGPIEYLEGIYRGDKYRFKVEIRK